MSPQGHLAVSGDILVVLGPREGNCKVKAVETVSSRLSILPSFSSLIFAPHKLQNEFLFPKSDHLNQSPNSPKSAIKAKNMKTFSDPPCLIWPQDLNSPYPEWKNTALREGKRENFWFYSPNGHKSLGGVRLELGSRTRSSSLWQWLNYFSHHLCPPRHTVVGNWSQGLSQDSDFSTQT